MKYLTMATALLLAACATSPTTPSFSVVGESQSLCAAENEGFQATLLCTWLQVTITIDQTENRDLDLIVLYFGHANKLSKAVTDGKINDDEARTLLAWAYRQVNVVANNRDRRGRPNMLATLGKSLSDAGAAMRASQPTVTNCQMFGSQMRCTTY